MKKLIALSLLLLIPAVGAQEMTLNHSESYEEPCKEEKVYTERWQRFISDNLPIALEIQEQFGIDPVFVLAQSALESGYGKHTPGNMFFGIKDHDGTTNGNEQLLKTHEFFSTPTKTFRRAQVLRIDSIAPNLYRYQIKDYFRKYDSPADSFKHHAEYLTRKLKGEVCCDALQLADKMAGIKYATSTEYTSSLKVAIKKIKNFVEEENLLPDGKAETQIYPVFPV